ncbi:MAG: glycosyl transferase [Microbacterium sp.]|uniref:glycosyl transferase n=1 Tax=Microbacterium sp. TaxID=51671 RepID=UPI003A8414BA
MRFVWAVVAFILAAVCIAGGIAQRTVFLGPDTERAEITATEDLPYLLVDGAVLTSMPGTQTLVVRDQGDVFAAYGRTLDLTAWLADTAYNHATIEDGEIVVDAVEPAIVPVDEDGLEAPPATRDPADSDLWLDEFRQDGALVAPLKLPDTMSVLISVDGAEPAPADISVSWPLDNSTPWAGPLMALGGLFLVIGVVLWLLGIRHVRRSRGPRRKGPPPLPETQPIDLTIEAGDKGVITAGSPPTERAIARAKRAYAIVPAVAVSALLFAGCSADAWPQFAADASPSPSPSESVIVPDGQQQPAVTSTQAERILTEIAQVVAEADEARDGDLAGTRLTGPALAERLTDYKLNEAIADREPFPAIPAKPLAVMLPQQFDGWPRTVMSVVYDNDDATVAPTIMMLTQQDPWSDYKVRYLASLEASAELPGVAPADIGAIQVQPDSPFLVMEPGDLAAAYADVVDNGDSSEFAGMFDLTNDHFAASVAQKRQEQLDAFNETGRETATLTFATKAGSEDPLALATLESGAIVAVNILETDTVEPKNSDVVIKLEGNPTVKALTGAAESATGVVTTMSDQLFFYVPGQGSTEKIRLLGYSSEYLSAAVIKK